MTRFYVKFNNVPNHNYSYRQKQGNFFGSFLLFFGNGLMVGIIQHDTFTCSVLFTVTTLDFWTNMAGFSISREFFCVYLIPVTRLQSLSAWFTAMKWKLRRSFPSRCFCSQLSSLWKEIPKGCDLNGFVSVCCCCIHCVSNTGCIIIQSVNTKESAVLWFLKCLPIMYNECTLSTNQ